MIHLSVGGYSVDWGKNQHYINHAELFQKEDLKRKVPDYGYSPPLMMEGYSKPLGDVVKRLDLLGYTMAFAKSEHKYAEDEYGEKLNHKLSFKTICDLAKVIDLHKVKGDWIANPEPLSVPKEIITKLDDNEYHLSENRPDYWDLDLLFRGFHPYSRLRLLALNSANWDVPVIWPFGELVKNGWAKRKDFLIKPVVHNKFLIVTEGSSDAKILQKALDLLRPTYKEFFRFIDMEEGYPFSGTGNLYKFCQGLVSIGIQNQVIIIYDNDTEGVSNYEKTLKLSLPKNMVVMKLPDLKSLKRFDSIGPHGRRKVDINGRAASIECYLDLTYKTDKVPLVRWSQYVAAMDRYQGALEIKGDYMKTFLRLKEADSTYDFSKVEAVLDHIYKLSVGVASKQFGAVPH